MNRRTLLLSLLALTAAGPVRAQMATRPRPDLKEAPDSATVAEARYCNGVYKLRMRDGSARDVVEFNMRIKTDAGPLGPRPDAPVVLPAGMVGDRHYLVFADLEEIGRFIQRC